MKKLNASFTIENGKELTLRMKCKDTKDFAENWLIIYNTARENKRSFLNCKLFFNSDIVILTTVDDEKVVKEWLLKLMMLNIGCWTLRVIMSTTQNMMLLTIKIVLK